MKQKIFLSVVLILALSERNFAQSLGIGVKAGLNFANITDASSINSSSAAGFLVGAFFGTPNTHVIGSRTELIFSRQGYDFNTNTTTGSVRLNYIILPQFFCINITKYVQVQLGGQVAYLISATADTDANTSFSPALSYFNRVDFGFAGGLEVHPFKGILIGARYNYSFGSLFSDQSIPTSGAPPSYIPSINAKNNVIQLFAGYMF
jgi:hypothetical protein